MNTRIAYLYRDGANYKQHHDVVVDGELSLDGLKSFLVDGMFFIPHDVGLPDLQHCFADQGCGFPSDDDHIWHELVAAEPTNDLPAVEIHAADLIVKFRTASDNGWNLTGALKRLGSQRQNTNRTRTEVL